MSTNKLKEKEILYSVFDNEYPVFEGKLDVTVNAR